MPEPIDPTRPVKPFDKWTAEFANTRGWKPYKNWREEAERIDKRLRDTKDTDELRTRWNLFSADTKRKEALLLGRVPQATVGRRFQDADDDEARVAADILQRLLNTDLEAQDDDQTEAYKNAMRDWLSAGCGWVRRRYVTGELHETPETPARLGPDGHEVAGAVAAQTRRPNEQAECDYINWRDVLWQAARTWGEVTWVAFLARMPVEDFDARFPTHKVKEKNVPVESTKDKDEDKRDDPVARVCVWEIEDKRAKKRVFFVEGYDVLEEANDPLEVPGFYSCPKPMMAFLTTSAFVPVPEYHLVRDLYEEVDRLSSRIQLIQEAIRVRGVYPAESPEVVELLQKAGGNELIAVQNWPAFLEKGGLAQMVQFLPLDVLTAALATLSQERVQVIDALHQITGQSDIMRGQATQAGATATEQRAKVKFGSVVLQAAQDEFARFVSDDQRLKAAIIAKHFEPETILQRCNCARTPDAQLAPQAVALLQQDISKWRIEVKPEAVNFQDFSALKEERTELLAAIGGFLQTMGPLAQQFGPSALPFLLEILKWLVAGMRGASSLEAVLDKAIQQAQQAAQAPQQQQPNPKVQELAIKGQQDMQKIQADLQADLTRIGAEVDADRQREANQMEFNVREHMAKTQISAAAKPPEKPASQGAPR